MEIPFYQINAFTDKLFSGNPAAVCVLPTGLPDNILQAIAKENNLPVTSFLTRARSTFTIRWFTPEYELDLCGHGTLAAAYVLFKYIEPSWKKINLQSSTEVLPVVYENDFIILDFPAKSIEPCSIPLLAKGLGLPPQEVYQYGSERCLAIYNTEEEVQHLKPNISALQTLEHRAICVTAPGEKVDFVSRTFYPQKTITEDPVTGASHCLLIPYWAKRLNKNQLHAKQISERGGELWCQHQDKRVLISGKAILYSHGVINYEEEKI